MSRASGYVYARYADYDDTLLVTPITVEQRNGTWFVTEWRASGC